MMITLAYRSLYRCFIRLHPRTFRQRFGEEMMCTFDEAVQSRKPIPLLLDGLVSLTRQWLFRPNAWRAPVSQPAFVVANLPLFAWDRIGVSARGLSGMRWVQGGLISLAFFVGVSGMAMRATRRAPVPRFTAGSQNALASPTAEWRGGSRLATAFASRFRNEERYATGYATGDAAKAFQLAPNRDRALLKFGRELRSALAAFFAADGSQSKAAVETPKTPAGEQFSAWLQSFNGGERSQIADFQKRFKNPPPEQQIEGELGFRRMTGGFTLRKIEESTPTRVTGLMQERNSDQFARFVMDVEPAAPHAITNWTLNAIATPAEFAVPRLSEPQLIEAANARIAEAVKNDQFSGAVLVTKNGKPIISGAYGMADREKKTPNTLSTQFRIGSMNKMFTATSVLQLVQAGKIKLSDPFGKYISDYSNKDVASKVSIQQLLTHTGGTGDIFGPDFDQHRKELRTLQDYVNLYGKRDVEFAPGSRWEYSNYGFLLLGVVVERVSGKSYYDYVAEKVYAPAGMTSSASLPEDENVPRRSIGYTAFGGSGLHPNTDTLPYRGTSAGGGYSTVEDLQRFASALLNHKLLNAEYTEMLTTGKVDTPRGDKYAFGFMDADADSGLRHFGHGGGAPGMNGDLQIYPQTGYVISVLSNLDPPAASRISDFIANRLPKN
jgi:D-alanyl-D-alanine carboxypeptidase